MNLPPYLLDGNPPPDEPEEPEASPEPSPPDPLRRDAARRKILVGLAGIALFAGLVGAGGMRVLGDSSGGATPTPTTVVTQRLGKVGETEIVGNWRVVVVNWGVGTVPHGSTNNRLIAWVTFTNDADHTRTWSAPDQVALRYLASDGHRNGAYIKSADDAGRDALRIVPGGNATMQYIWRLPIDASGFALLFRPDARSPRAADVSLECC